MANKASTQQNVPIAGIKDGIVVLSNGQYRLILEVTAINFDLKSDQEQNALVFQYQSFLNSLHFPIQILIQSKKLDLTPYLNRITDLSKKQTNELLKIQTDDYIDFVKQLIGIANIMKKSFYVVVGYQPLSTARSGILGKIFPKKETSSTKIRVSDQEFTHHTKELRQRAQVIASGLASMGIHAKQVSTQESIELFYKIYNPEISGKERMTDTETISSSFVASETERPIAATDNQKTEEVNAPTIDNTNQVQEANKQKQAEAEQENMKTAEKSVATSSPQPTAPKKASTASSDSPAPTGVASNASDQTPNLPKIEKVEESPGTPKASEPQAAPLNPHAPDPATPVAPKDPSVSAPPVPDPAASPVNDPALNKNFGE